jgi:hypothetical protein
VLQNSCDDGITAAVAPGTDEKGPKHLPQIE